MWRTFSVFRPNMQTHTLWTWMDFNEIHWGQVATDPWQCSIVMLMVFGASHLCLFHRVDSSHLDSELGHMIFAFVFVLFWCDVPLGHQKIWHEQRIINTSVFEISHFECCHCHFKEPSLYLFKGKNHSERVAQLYQLSQLIPDTRQTTTCMQLHEEPGQDQQTCSATHEVGRKETLNHYFESLRFETVYHTVKHNRIPYCNSHLPLAPCNIIFISLTVLSFSSVFLFSLYSSSIDFISFCYLVFLSGLPSLSSLLTLSNFRYSNNGFIWYFKILVGILNNKFLFAVWLQFMLKLCFVFVGRFHCYFACSSCTIFT